MENHEEDDSMHISTLVSQPRKKRNAAISNYIDKQELFDEILKYKKSGKTREERQASEKLGKFFMILVDHIMGMPTFKRYDASMKEDMKGYAYIKLMKGLESFDADSPSALKGCFCYFTKAVTFAFLYVIGNHYKQVNLIRDLTIKSLEQSDFIDPRAKALQLEELHAQKKDVDRKLEATKERKRKAFLKKKAEKEAAEEAKEASSES